MFGSDWPVSMYVPQRRGYGEWFAIVTGGLAGADLDAVEWRTAAATYRLDVDVGEQDRADPAATT
jgi:predicted TIM-barrel fold metal-dependent hydrolase